MPFYNRAASKTVRPMIGPMFSVWRSTLAGLWIASCLTAVGGSARGAVPTDNTVGSSGGQVSQGTEPAPLQARSGITALSGRVVDMNGQGLPGVKVSDNTQDTLSDEQGLWVLPYVPTGRSVLRIDGRHAGVKRDADHGVYEVRVEAKAGQTTVLQYKSWLPLVDHANEVAIPSPTTSEVVVRNPNIPDLELHIAAGVVIRDIDGRVVRRVGLTAMPFDKLPFPVPKNFHMPFFFTMQPGAACLYTPSGGIGQAQLWYPNFNHELPRARATLWAYVPDGNGWQPIGTGTVSADGRQIVPDAGVAMYDLGSAECQPATRSKMDPPVRQRVRPTHP